MPSLVLLFEHGPRDALEGCQGLSGPHVWHMDHLLVRSGVWHLGKRSQCILHLAVPAGMMGFGCDSIASETGMAVQQAYYTQALKVQRCALPADK